jgi:hypothetical protein
VAFTVNGATLISATPQSVVDAVTGAISSVQIADMTYLNVGDYVQALGFQSSGGALATVAGGCSLTVWWTHE